MPTRLFRTAGTNVPKRMTRNTSIHRAGCLHHPASSIRIRRRCMRWAGIGPRCSSKYIINRRRPLPYGKMSDRKRYDIASTRIFDIALCSDRAPSLGCYLLRRQRFGHIASERIDGLRGNSLLFVQRKGTKGRTAVTRETKEGCQRGVRSRFRRETMDTPQGSAKHEVVIDPSAQGPRESFACLVPSDSRGIQIPTHVQCSTCLAR